ncbi:hypothetical protein [Lysinibacillus sp. CTST325]
MGILSNCLYQLPIQSSRVSIPVGDTAKACEEKYEELEQKLDKKLKNS